MPICLTKNETDHKIFLILFYQIRDEKNRKLFYMGKCGRTAKKVYLGGIFPFPIGSGRAGPGMFSFAIVRWQIFRGVSR